MSNLTEFSLLRARVKCGAMLYKVDKYLEDKESFYVIDPNASPYLSGHFLSSEPKLCVMHPDVEPEFLRICKEKGIDVIPAKEYWDAERNNK